MVARAVHPVESRPAGRAMREDLAACHRLVARFGMTELIYNHATARVPGRPDRMFVKPDHLLYEQVNASNLVECDLDGTVMDGGPPINHTVPIIHGAIYRARPELHCILHTHTPAGMAVSAMDCGLLPLNQTAMQFHDRIGYYDYEGPATDTDECARLVRDLGPHRAMIMRNHGLLTCGATVSEALVRMYYLDKSCQSQVMAMTAASAGNAKLHLPSRDVCEHTARCWDDDDKTKEWPAYIALLEREAPDFRD